MGNLALTIRREGAHATRRYARAEHLMRMRSSCLWQMKAMGAYGFPYLRATLMQGQAEALTWRTA